MGLLDKFRKKEQRKTVVVGLDGVPYTLLRDLIYRGHIPNMESIFETGYFGQMSVCIPEISSVSWSSFMTGTQSGKHGIFGFMDFEPGTYKMYFPNFTHLKAPTLWDDLAEQGKKTVVINMPSTYPAREINGILISGFVAVDFSKAVYPPSMISELKKMEYRIDLDTLKARQDYDFLFRDLDASLKGRERALDFFWTDVDWDLFIIIITGTDRLMHFLWEAYEDETHKYHQAFLDYFNKVDKFVGKVYEKLFGLEDPKDGNNQFFMLSDHGFTKLKTEVYINRWLEDNGYLRFQKNVPETIMDIGPGSKAFAMDPSRIYVNLKGKYPLGTIEDGDYNGIRKELIEGLSELAYTDGQKIAKKIYVKEDLYEGPYFDMAPDLVILSHHGYDLKGKVQSGKVFDRTNLQGMHTQDDAFFFSSSGNRCESIFDVKDVIQKPFLD